MKENDLIIKKAANGDDEAFRIIVEQYKNLVYAVCKNIVKDPHEAENLTQETFLQVYKSLHKYEYKGFKNWIGRIAVNKSIDYKRRLASKQENEIKYIDEMECLPDNKALIQDRLIQEERKREVICYCNELPLKYKSVIKKFYIQNKSYKEIAAEENISIKTVETRLYRAKNLLRKKIEEVEET
ncbi:RNA polymerase sigma factor [Clostridium ganghwense]|uniref:RNA polymerase sigma factor n=1 Tax=Clostridium ganghwense TaxID=312089 RepID=A0ABT4CNV6_9CLOT|nr:RNA polymerase sigma factor [Clostridium ganghwense]MCY6369911.1 RNA polymerase sigma factor [Clostridium ganghwense]